MNANQPNAVPANQPTVVQQTTVIQVGSHKSVGGAVALAFFLGPLGMLYATVPGAFLMFFINVLVLIWTAGIGLLLTIPLGMIWAGAAASSHNKGMGIATQAIAAPAPHRVRLAGTQIPTAALVSAIGTANAGPSTTPRLRAPMRRRSRRSLRPPRLRCRQR